MERQDAVFTMPCQLRQAACFEAARQTGMLPLGVSPPIAWPLGGVSYDAMVEAKIKALLIRLPKQ